MTIIVTWVGSRTFNFEQIRLFFFKWPRNFSIAFCVELLIAQPIARFVMTKLHTGQCLA